MDFLREANFKKTVQKTVQSQFRKKFHFKWTFYGKLIHLKTQDWFCDKAAVQHKILFRMDFLRKVNSC